MKSFKHLEASTKEESILFKAVRKYLYISTYSISIEFNSLEVQQLQNTFHQMPRRGLQLFKKQLKIALSNQSLMMHQELLPQTTERSKTHQMCLSMSHSIKLLHLMNGGKRLNKFFMMKNRRNAHSNLKSIGKEYKPPEVIGAMQVQIEEEWLHQTLIDALHYMRWEEKSLTIKIKHLKQEILLNSKKTGINALSPLKPINSIHPNSKNQEIRRPLVIRNLLRE
jgi:hypothetical protein